MATATPRALDVAALRAAFAPGRPPTVGIEEELMLLDPETFDLLPRADEVLARASDPGLFRRELPAAQVELAAPPRLAVPDAAAALGRARRDAARAASGIGLLAGAGTHPFAPAEGVLNAGERYARILDEYGPIARRQLVFGLHVHVAVGGPDTAIAALRGVRDRLPELAALAANAAYFEGADSGLASVRPKLCDLLPRQGVPPHLPDMESLAEALAWGAAAGSVPDAGQWWWEARLHASYGTLEVRCPDTQATIADTAAIAAVVQCLVVWLAERFEAGEDDGFHGQAWRIGENRWSACRHGVHGTMADLRTGRARPTQEALGTLLDDLAPTASRLGCAAEVEHARRLAARNGADRQRDAGRERGARGVAEDLAGRFLCGLQG